MRAVRVVPLLIATIVAVIGPIAPSASADPVLSVTVTPNTGLLDGQVVRVTATGFMAQAVPEEGNIAPYAVQCPAGLLPPGPFVIQFSDPSAEATFRHLAELVNEHCAQLGAFPVTNAAVTTLDVIVHRSSTTLTGSVLHCGATPGDCVISVGGTVFAGFAAGGVSVPISFAPPTPRTKNDCKNDGWHRVANAEGQPFRNQGQCIDWFRHHRH